MINFEESERVSEKLSHVREKVEGGLVADDIDGKEEGEVERVGEHGEGKNGSEVKGGRRIAQVD